ncbi:Alpha-crystallin domain-containing protein 22.3 [Capsicum annuum]|nr:Alpha-crystallin domain-containing protein 22.3 [Capsicum annuum]
MQNANPVSTLLVAHFKLSATLSRKTNDECDYMSLVSHSSAIGSLMYAMVCSRPDLSYAISAVSRYMANLGKEHWKTVQWIFRYLHGYADVSLQFGKIRYGVISYVDSNFAGNHDKNRSLTCYFFTIGGCAISWKATLQTMTALSTTEADQSAIFLMKDQMVQEKTKHIDVQYHFHLSANLGAQSFVMEDELCPGCWGSFGGGGAVTKTSGVMTRSSFTTGHGLRKLYEERSKSLENSQPAMVSSSASPASEEWDNVISFTGSASLEKAGPLVGSVDAAESMDEYLFRVSLPGVTRDEKVISCEVRPDGRILIKGESATGESMVCKHNGWEKPNLEDQEQCSVDSGTFLQLLALFASCFSSFVCVKRQHVTWEALAGKLAWTMVWVVEVKRVDDRLMLIKMVIRGSMLNVISAYTLQAGLNEEEMKSFGRALDKVV